MPSGHNSQKPPKNLTERRFRAYFERTEGGKEQLRFAAVLKAMEEDSRGDGAQIGLAGERRPRPAHLACG